MSNLTVDVDDLLRRAVHTFLQAFVAVLSVTWAASGIDVSQVDDLASAKRIALAAVAAVVAAALSALKTTVASLLPAGKLRKDDDDLGVGMIDDQPDELTEPTSKPALDPAPLVTGSLAPVQAPPHPMPGRHEA